MFRLALFLRHVVLIKQQSHVLTPHATNSTYEKNCQWAFSILQHIFNQTKARQDERGRVTSAIQTRPEPLMFLFGKTACGTKN